jgi:hypothetical protein
MHPQFQRTFWSLQFVIFLLALALRFSGLDPCLVDHEFPAGPIAQGMAKVESEVMPPGHFRPSDGQVQPFSPATARPAKPVTTEKCAERSVERTVHTASIEAASAAGRIIASLKRCALLFPFHIFW